jgi:hypothetical protein
MPSDSWSERARDLLAFAVIAAVTIAARLPFLLRADRFFDADEAVEGLMARHVLLGENPLFLWGQRYKGVPEVYLTSVVFRAAGSSVVALKAVTLACFIVFVCLNFRLVERVCSRRIAWIATALFIAGPPALVQWTLTGSAEIVMTLLCGVVLLLAVEWWRRARSTGALVLAGVAIGAGLWIQKYILYYVVALAITAAWEIPDWRATLTGLLRQRLPAWLRAGLAVLAAVAAVYVLLGLLAFLGVGLDTRIAGVRITATHPQKMWWIAGALVVVIVGVGAVSVFRRQVVWPVLGLLAGYMPAIVGRIGNPGLGEPISRLDLASLGAAWPDIIGLMLPVLLGFRDPMARRTIVAPLALALLTLAVISYMSVRRHKMTPYFHVFPLVAIAMFFVSGSYIDPTSYRYLMPIYAALPVIYAVGVDALWRWSRSAGVVALVFMLLLFAAQQLGWYQHLEPDRASAQIIACLDGAGVRAARAGYWLSYKITFLTGERIIVAPLDGVDRYPPYSALAGGDGPVDAVPCFSPSPAR